jgi:OOP family OmpA-OmpF porin
VTVGCVGRAAHGCRLGCVLGCALGSSAFLGCAAAPIREGQLQSVQRSIEHVTRAGALACAPRELALARAHYDFALLDLEQGDAQRALQQLVVAEENVGAAQVLTSERACSFRARGAEEMRASAPGKRMPDRDHDSIPDDRDACPYEAEDGRAPFEADGCMMSDADADGVADALDACPYEPHGRDETHADDGCPSPHVGAVASSDKASLATCRDAVACAKTGYPNLTIHDKELKLSNPVVFWGDSSNLRESSYAVLDTVAEVLRDHPSMTLDIVAHTDDRGEHARNLLLSQEQAESVRRYLVERGVAATRLTAQGYGETRPIESNSTSRGRAINRRIDLMRTDRVQ